MKKFRKVAIKTHSKRDKLGKINSQIRKRTKVPGIIKVHELNLTPSTTSMLSMVLPEIERIASYNFPKQVKSALIANIVDQIPQAPDEQSITKQSISDNFAPHLLSTPKYRTPASKIGKVSNTREDSIVKKLSHLHNSNREIIDSEGYPLPNSNIDEIAKWLRSSNPLTKRGPVGTRTVAADLAKNNEILGESIINIRNPHFHEKLISVKRRLEEKEKADFKRTKRQEGGGKWQSLGIRY